MTESCSEGLLGTWAPPECPFKIAYSLRALDDIRLAVTDAFFSLPRGGAEIGGILLGRRDAQQVTILDYVALDCEHALGPSFTLSPRDLAHLSVLLEEARKNTPDLQPVGWYHSHTRSEIFLSEADLEIHKRYFTAPWQVALVLKPHTFQPTRAGFFFRDAQGSFHEQGSYREFVLDPLPMRTVPDGTVPRLAAPESGRMIGGSERDVEVAAANSFQALPAENLQANSESDFAGTGPEPANPSGPVAAPSAQPGPAVDEIPIHFPDLDGRPRWRAAALLTLAACLAMGAFAFETRQIWLPHIWHGSAVAASTAPAASPLGLVLTDQDGQLQIRWDRQSPSVRAASRGTLEIASSGGGIPNAVRLDAAQLQSAAFTYKRETEKVDVILSVEGSGGELGRESAVFFGKLPSQHGAADPEAAKQRDELAVEVERLKGDLKAQVARYQQLLKSTDQHGDLAAETERLRSQLNAQVARTKDLEKALKPKDDQIAKLRNDLSVQASHNKVLAQALDEAEAQLLLQRQKRLSNQVSDTGKR